jgi:hypothetical protein
MNLTPRQTDVLVAIRNYRHLHGYAPTMQELADSLGTSKVTIFEHVGALEKKKILKRDKHKARSLEIISEKKLPDEHRTTKLPLLGSIAAGSPIEAVENREEIDLEELFNARSGVYVLRAAHRDDLGMRRGILRRLSLVMPNSDDARRRLVPDHAADRHFAQRVSQLRLLDGGGHEGSSKLQIRSAE